MTNNIIKIDKGEKYFFYLDKLSGDISNENFGCRLTNPIEPDVLKEAVTKAVSTFPLYGTRPVLDNDGYVYLMKNDNPIKLFTKSNNNVAFGTMDTNGYLFKVVYYDDTFEIHVHHSLGDGRTVMGFLLAIAYQYLRLKGIEIDTEGLIYTEKDLSDATLMDSFLDAAKKAQIDEPKDAYIPQNVFNYLEGETVSSSDSANYQITWKQSDLIDKVHELEVTPAPFIAAVMAEAFSKCKEIGDKHIVAGIPVDMRAKMNSRSQKNYIGNIRLPFYPEWLDLPLGEKARKLKEEMVKQMYFPNIITRVRMLDNVVEKMTVAPLYVNEEGKSTQNGKNEKSNLSSQTYLLTNIGRVRLPKDMMPYVADFILIPVQSRTDNISVGLVSIGDRGCLMLAHPFKSEKLVKTICEILEEQGIHSSYEDITVEKDETVDTLGICDFMRI